MSGRRFFNALRPSKRLSSRYSVEQRPAERAPAALNSPNETDRKTRAQNTGQAKSLRGKQMGRSLAAFVVAASLLTLAPSEAAAWECRAAGLGSSGYARAYDIVDAKLFALRQCERRSPLPVCTLVWCRPGGSRIISTAPVTDMPRQGSPTGRSPARQRGLSHHSRQEALDIRDLTNPC
jgi:hypothetical protein